MTGRAPYRLVLFPTLALLSFRPLTVLRLQLVPKVYNLVTIGTVQKSKPVLAQLKLSEAPITTAPAPSAKIKADARSSGLVKSEIFSTPMTSTFLEVPA